MSFWLCPNSIHPFTGLSIFYLIFISLLKFGGAWVAQSVERPTSAQVMISQSVSSSPASGSVLTAQSLEPALHSVSPSLSALPSHALSLLCAPSLPLKMK